MFRNLSKHIVNELLVDYFLLGHKHCIRLPGATETSSHFCDWWHERCALAKMASVPVAFVTLAVDRSN